MLHMYYERMFKRVCEQLKSGPRHPQRRVTEERVLVLKEICNSMDCPSRFVSTTPCVSLELRSVSRIQNFDVPAPYNSKWCEMVVQCNAIRKSAAS